MTKHGTNEYDNTHAHTHTKKQTNFKTDLMLSVPNNYNSLLWMHGPALDQLLKTVALQSLQQTQ